jgi:hypothetical protein
LRDSCEYVMVCLGHAFFLMLLQLKTSRWYSLIYLIV